MRTWANPPSTARVTLHILHPIRRGRVRIAQLQARLADIQPVRVAMLAILDQAAQQRAATPRIDPDMLLPFAAPATRQAITGLASLRWQRFRCPLVRPGPSSRQTRTLSQTRRRRLQKRHLPSRGRTSAGAIPRFQPGLIHRLQLPAIHWQLPRRRLPRWDQLRVRWRNCISLVFRRICASRAMRSEARATP